MPNQMTDSKWIEMRDQWLAFCNGNGSATRNIVGCGRTYYTFTGPNGEKFRSWKKCAAFMNKGNMTAYDPDPVKPDPRGSGSEPNIGLKLDQLDENIEKLNAMIAPNFDDSLPNFNQLLEDQAFGRLTSTYEKSEEVPQGSLPGRMNVDQVRSNTIPTEDLQGEFYSTNNFDSGSSNYRPFRTSETGNLALNFSPKFDDQIYELYRNEEESLRTTLGKERSANNLKEHCEQKTPEQHQILWGYSPEVRNGENNDAVDIVPLNKVVQVSQAPCEEDGQKRNIHMSEKEVKQTRNRQLPLLQKGQKVHVYRRRKHERTKEASRSTGLNRRHGLTRRTPLQKTNDLLCSRAGVRSVMTNDSDMLLSFLWNNYMKYRRILRNIRSRAN